MGFRLPRRGHHMDLQTFVAFLAMRCVDFWRSCKIGQIHAQTAPHGTALCVQILISPKTPFLFLHLFYASSSSFSEVKQYIFITQVSLFISPTLQVELRLLTIISIAMFFFVKQYRRQVARRRRFDDLHRARTAERNCAISLALLQRLPIASLY